MSDAQAPIYFWSQVQDKVLVRLGEWLEQGWEPVTPVGPSCLVIKYGQKFNWKWMLTENTAQLMECRIKAGRLKPDRRSAGRRGEVMPRLTNTPSCPVSCATLSA
ncbi:MAG: hypothetical protein U0703_20555 [Anaerolineae bacterium]